MGGEQGRPRPSGREIFDGALSGALDRPFVPRLRSDPPSTSFRLLARSLEDFRQEEGPENREKRLHAVWKRIPHPRKAHHSPPHQHAGNGDLDAVPSSWVPPGENASLTREKAEKLTAMYHDELLKECALEEGNTLEPVTWGEFKKYADYKEAGVLNGKFVSCSQKC